MVEKKFSDLDKLANEFYNCVEKVSIKDSENVVHMGISFTNTISNFVYLGEKKILKNFSFMFWPVYGEVEYEFKKGDFFLNQGSDPRVIIRPYDQFSSSLYFSKLFFTKNPFKNLKHYGHIDFFLPDVLEKNGD